MKCPALLALVLPAVTAWSLKVLPGRSSPKSHLGKTPVTFSSRVNLVSVPVVVRDRDGQNQRRGKDCRAGLLATSPAGTLYPCLADDIHLQPGDLLDTKRAMTRHLDESLDASSRAAIFTTSGRIPADFPKSPGSRTPSTRRRVRWLSSWMF